MYCPCFSHSLYCSISESQKFKLKSSISNNIEYFYLARSPLTIKTLENNPYIDLYKNIIDLSSISFPPEIESIDFLEIKENPLFFQKNFVSKNIPCKIINAINNWEILDLCSDPSYLSEKIKEEITIDITPDGFADSIKNKFFVQPSQIKSTIKNFFSLCQDSNDTVPYIQMQNDNFNKEFNGIFNQNEIDHSISNFFSKNFFTQNQSPDAINFWMGDKRSVSSIHKDHYENIYCVVNGEKHFSLIPPVFYPILLEGKYYNGKWVKNKDEWIVESSESLNDTTNWLTVNPDCELDWIKYKLTEFKDVFKNYHVVVEKGEVLYLPSLWLHQVSQINKKDQFVIAINYWFDMEFGNNFAFLELLRGLF